MVIADDVTGRDFVTNIIVATCNLGDVHPEVREDLYRHCDDLLNHARDATKLASCQAIAMARFEKWLSREIDSREDSKARMALHAALMKWKEIRRG